MAGASPGSTAVRTAGQRPRADRAPTAPTSPDEVLKEHALRVDSGPVASPSRSVPRPLLPAARSLASTAASWALSPAAAPWRGDLVRAAVVPAVVLAAAVSPGRTVPATAVLLVAGAYLLLVLTAALGRLDSGLRIPPAVLAGLDALHLLWAAHLTSGLGGPVPVIAATAAVCLLLRIVLLPPLDPRSTPPGRAAPAPARPLVLAGGRSSAPRPAPRRCPRCPHGGSDRPQRERLQVGRAEA